jgi:hypothetical protein
MKLCFKGAFWDWYMPFFYFSINYRMSVVASDIHLKNVIFLNPLFILYIFKGPCSTSMDPLVEYPRYCHTLISFTCPCYCLHPLQELLVFPQCIYPCVSCLSVPVRLVCFQVNQCFFPLSCLCYSPFSSLPSFDPCLFWSLYPPAWLFCLPYIEPACHPVPSGLRTGLTFCLSTTILLPTPFWIIKHLKLQPSASCVCIWVSPCVMIDISFDYWRMYLILSHELGYTVFPNHNPTYELV